MAVENSMSDDELRSLLISYGQKVGPVTSTTRNVYLRKLRALQAIRGRSAPLKLSFNRRHLGGFSSDESDAEEREDGWTSGSKGIQPSNSPAYDHSPRLSESFDQFSRGRGGSFCRTPAGTNNLSYGASPSRVVSDGDEFARGRSSLDSSGLCRPSINGVRKSYPSSPMRDMSDSVSDFRMRGNSDYRTSSDPYRNDFASGFHFSGGSAHGGQGLRDEDLTPPTTGPVQRKPSGRLSPNRVEATPKTDSPFSSALFSPKTKNNSTHAVGGWQNVSMFLFALGMGFFFVLPYIYWTMTSSNTDYRNNFLICDDDDDSSFEICVPRNSEEFIRSSVKRLIDEISMRAGSFDCGYDEMSRNFSVQELDAVLKQEGGIYLVIKPEIKTMIMRLFVVNPHWSIRLYDADDVLTSNLTLVKYLVSEKSQMSLWCRFRMSAAQVIWTIVTVMALGAALYSGFALLRFWTKRKEDEMKEVVELVEKILDKLKLHADACQMQPDLKPYLAIAHVRDSLIPLQDRCRMQGVWNKAVQFIESHESRVRTESQMIEAEEFIVWRWVSPATDVTKVWQGQAFGEHGNKIQSYPPLTTCLKIRNMFDVDVEYGDNWHVSIEDAILEKCGPNHGVLHVAVDQTSRDGCVYVRCRDLDSVGRAFKALHGWWFDGKLVTVKYLREQRYFERFPEAVEASDPVKPSNSNQSSLSQPYHSSIMESS